MKKTIKVMAIYMASTHIPTLRCIGFSSSYSYNLFISILDKEPTAQPCD